MNEWMQKDRRRAFEVVDRFEETVGEYTGAPYVVSVDSCTNALFLACLFSRTRFAGGYDDPQWVFQHKAGTYPRVSLPRRTYVGVVQAVRNAGYRVTWRDEDWRGEYELWPLGIVDAAKRFTSGMYRPRTLTCVSFQAGKLLPIGRGGAILTDDAEAAEWLRRARFDGRTEGARCDAPDAITTPGFHCYLDPPSAARGLWLMTYVAKDQPDQPDEYEDLSTLEAFR
jgi:dTDP-4-amino-4,6-dideoxygalactose transaminase